ncbi:MAG: ribonuclease III [Nitrospira bacterium HGW-Nitrospira-1]|nr:MAG: ribonuclease III [Nitrospira bacterium HGW-Nitrospira-1]
MNIRSITESIGYVFKDKSLLAEALTHKSYYHENRDTAPSHNERLEFLGDAVLGLIVVENLFLQEKQYPESVLAKVKSYLVSEVVLADIAASMSLGKYLSLGKGEESTGGRDKKSILADALEALIGAVYLDSGYERTKSIVLGFFKERINSAIQSGEFFDYKTELQEKIQLLYGTLPEYRVIRQQGEEHERIFTVAVYLNNKKLGTASGRRKKEAETLAAKKALGKIN